MTAMRKFTRTLTAAEEIVINAAGSSVVQCSGGTGEFTVRPDDQNPVILANGLGIRYLNEFKTLRITNGPTPQTIELYIGSGDIVDNRLSLTGAITNRPLANQSAAYGAISVGLAATLIRAANAGRSSCAIRNYGAVAIYLGNDAAVTEALGLPISPGQTLTVTFADAIYAISGTAAQDVRFLEESV